MGLSRLLAVGRSVRSVTGQPARYKLTQQNLLPTFGGAKAAEGQGADLTPPVPETAAKAGPAILSATTPGTQSDVVRTKAEPDRSAAFLEATAKLRPFSGLWSKNPFARAAKKTESRPVQTELSLDLVKPVRNDLSDSEAELGGTSRELGNQPVPSASAPKAPSGGTQPTGGLWQRLKTRLFGAADAD